MHLQKESLTTLREIGEQLDQNQFPIVHNGGIVLPSETSVLCSTLGKEKTNVRQRQRRSATRPWQGPAGRQRQAVRRGPPRDAASVVGADLQKQYEAQLSAFLEAYPDTECWHRVEGMWLLTESRLLHGLGKKATFLTMLPYSRKFVVKSWGFWSTPISFEWIGPRHTNFPDGSICAFERRDVTWVAGDSIIKLLDLYSLWALRHLHLDIFGRWPGHQFVPHPHERLTELSDDEYCGCDHPNKPYADCCKKHDLARDRAADALDFLLRTGVLRKPPGDIMEFLRRRKYIDHNEKPPTMGNFLSEVPL